MAKKKKKKKEKVLNDRPRKVFRKSIPTTETLFSTFFVGFVLLMGIWFAAQKNAYDAGERDISDEAMIASSVEDNLYVMPLERWRDPANAQAFGAAPIEDIGIMPQAILQGGWQTSSRLELFDFDNLYEKINGQETQYKAYDFQYLHFISITNPQEDLDMNIEIYDMGIFSNALGVFSAQRSEGREVTQYGNTFYYETEAGGIGLVDKYYFKLTGSENDERLQKKAFAIMEDFSASAGEAAAIPKSMLMLTDGLGVEFSEIDYVLNDVFQYAFAKDFWFGRPDPEVNTQYFVHEASSDEEAQELFDQILEEHLYEYGMVSQADDSVLLTHEYLKTFFSLNRMGSVVYGIDGAKTGVEAADALGAFQEILLGEAEASLGDEEM